MTSLIEQALWKLYEEQSDEVCVWEAIYGASPNPALAHLTCIYILDTQLYWDRGMHLFVIFFL